MSRETRLDPWNKPIATNNPEELIGQVGSPIRPKKTNLTMPEDSTTFIEEELKEVSSETNILETTAVEEELIKEAQERLSRISALSSTSLVSEADQVNKSIAELEKQMLEKWDKRNEELEAIKKNYVESKEKYGNAISTALSARDDILKLNQQRKELIKEYFDNRTERAQLEYFRIKTKSKPSDLSPSDYAYINKILDHGDNKSIAETLKKFNWHPDLIDLVNSVRVDLKLSHPLELLSDSKFNRGLIKEHNGQYTAIRMNFLEEINKGEPSSIPKWAWPIPDKYLKKDPWGKPLNELPSESMKRLKGL